MCVLRMSPEVQNTEFSCLQGCDSKVARGGALCQTVCVTSKMTVVSFALMKRLVDY